VGPGGEYFSRTTEAEEALNAAIEALGKLREGCTAAMSGRTLVTASVQASSLQASFSSSP